MESRHQIAEGPGSSPTSHVLDSLPQGSWHDDSAKELDASPHTTLGPLPRTQSTLPGKPRHGLDERGVLRDFDEASEGQLRRVAEGPGPCSARL